MEFYNKISDNLMHTCVFKGEIVFIHNNHKHFILFFKFIKYQCKFVKFLFLKYLVFMSICGLPRHSS